jgi:hypothetical protein
MAEIVPLHAQSIFFGIWLQIISVVVPGWKESLHSGPERYSKQHFPTKTILVYQRFSHHGIVILTSRVNNIHFFCKGEYSI